MKCGPIFLFCLLLSGTTESQRRIPVADDEFSRNLLITVNRVYSVLEQPKNHLKLLAGPLDSVGEKGTPVHSAMIISPGSVSTTVEKIYVNQQEKTVRWEWCARFVREPKKTADTAAARRLQIAIDTLLSSFIVGKPGVRIYTYNSLDQSWVTDCLLDVRIAFKQPYRTTPEEARDSVVALYLPMLKDKTFTSAASYQFYGALDIEGFSNEEKVEIIMPVVKEVINHDFYAGYLFVLNRPYYVKSFDAALTAEQRQRVTKTAREELDKYYDSFSKKENPPVVQQVQKKPAERVPTDPCEREIYNLANKPGQYIIYNGTTALISAYSCPDNTYTICYLDTKGKLTFANNLSVSAIAGAARTSASPFIICSNCRGKGHFMEYDWYDMNSYTGHYARSNKLRQITCGVCSGSGHIKVR